MKVKVIRKLLHADISITIRIIVIPNMPMHVLCVIHEVVQLKNWRTASNWLTMVCQDTRCSKERYQQAKQ
jgi:hypothetical protein